MTRRLGQAVLWLVVACAIGAPWLSPNPPERRFADLLYAPPTRVHVGGATTAGPFIFAPRLESRLERRFTEDTSRPVALRWFTNGSVVTADADRGAPLLLLGTDAYGRDIFARLLYGARVTLLLAVLSAAGATLLGAVVGGLSGYAGGRLDAVVSRVTEFVLVLPATYVALSLRGALPLVLPAAAVFGLLTAIFVLFGWPTVARGVRAIVLSERGQDYILAARASGAGAARVVVRHLLPAARPAIVAQAVLLLPAFIVAEATLSYVGLGFPETVPTWGTMLQESANVASMDAAPWALAPAVAIFLVVVGVNLAVQDARRLP
jgi:peptide/nickel transport system permease protein